MSNPCTWSGSSAKQSSRGVDAIEQVLASFRSGERYWAEARSDEHHVRVYGDAAVVVGRWRARGQNGADAFDYQARYVSVWVRRDAGWLMVSDQSTPM